MRLLENISYSTEEIKSYEFEQVLISGPTVSLRAPEVVVLALSLSLLSQYHKDTLNLNKPRIYVKKKKVQSKLMHQPEEQES